MTSPKPQAGLVINVGVGQRPDRKHAVILNIATDLFSFQIALPPDAASSLGATLAPQLEEGAEQARRADTGLIVANTVPQPTRSNTP